MLTALLYNATVKPKMAPTKAPDAIVVRFLRYTRICPLWGAVTCTQSLLIRHRLQPTGWLSHAGVLGMREDCLEVI